VKVKSNLRWAGGKSKMTAKLDNFFPKEINKYFEVFVGGGSVMLYIIQKYKPYKIIANDINDYLINYYKNIQTKPQEIIDYLLTIKNKYTKETFKPIFKVLNSEESGDFFILNKTSFSGLNTNYSIQAYDKNFSLNGINKINNISKLIQQVEFINKDFVDLDLDLSDYFIYLDPPYYSNKEKGLYGKKGLLHKNFNHEALFDFVEHYGIDNKIMISYDDCDYIRQLYKNYNIYGFDFVYSMTNVGNNKCKVGKEIVITNYPINLKESE
jgi:DNA adenine methylase